MAGLRHNIDIAPQELFVTSTTQQGDLGALATDGFGRFFRYCSAGSTTALVVGKVYQGPTTSNSNYQAIGMGTVGTLSTVFSTGTNVTLASNEVAGGWVSVRSGSGAGYLYRIKSNTAATAGSSTITIEDPLQVAFQTSSTLIDLIPSPYSNLVIAATTAVSTPVGVAVAAIPASSFGWIQTRGPASVLNDATAVTVGGSIVASTVTAGSVTGARGSAVIVGQALVTTTASVNNPVFLTLE